LCDAETLTLRKVGLKYLESSEMSCWRRRENIRWTNCVRKIKYYIESRGRGVSYIQYKKGSLTGLVTYCIVTAL
jgi:hypothetical protein